MMRLEKKTAVIYGGGGAIGGAVARALAREGATVHLAGPTAAKLEAVAATIGAAATTAVVDALDLGQVEAHLDAVGRVDVSVNAVGLQNGAQGKPLVDMSPEEFGAPITAYTRANFVTAGAAARRMAAAGSGVVIGLSSPMARTATALTGSFTMASAAVELLLRQLAAEVGPSGVRAVCLRLTGIPESAARLGSSTEGVWRDAAERLGVPFEELLAQVGAGSPLGRPLTVAEVAEVAAFVASDAASALTATVVNVSAGAVID